MMFAQVGCPFVDLGVFRISLELDKELLVGNKLYNTLWREYFPELSHIRKAGQGGSARNSDFGYRLKYLGYASVKKTLFPLVNKMTGGRFKGEEAYFSNREYLADHENKEYFQELLLGGGVDFLPWEISEATIGQAIRDPQAQQLYLRSLSLLSFLKD